ncbi:MAG TPA: PfkB family carbohydrate kinase [Bdellovibrionota bacterium]|nr:PfkB family carbohydrate kinase [Bdellovibrionota bacterium]
MNVVCVGDCAVDRYVNLGLDRPGGITLNFAVNLRRLLLPQHSVKVISPVGRDAEAALVQKAVRDHKLDAHLPVRDGRTAVQWIDQQPSGEKIFFRYDEGVLADFRIGPAELQILNGADVWVGNVYRQVQGYFDSFMDAGKPRVRVVDFTNLADFEPALPFVERYADRVDVAFFGLDSAQDRLIESLGEIAASKNRVYVITLGADGSVAFEGGKRHRRPADKVEKVVDTTGAGDTYAAAFMARYLTSGDVASAMADGGREAALKVGRVGAF